MDTYSVMKTVFSLFRTSQLIPITDRFLLSWFDIMQIELLSTYVHLSIYSIKSRRSDIFDWWKLFVQWCKSERLSHLINYLWRKETVPCDLFRTIEWKSPGYSIFKHITERESVMCEIHWMSSWESFVIQRLSSVHKRDWFDILSTDYNQEMLFVSIHTDQRRAFECMTIFN